MQNLLRKLRLIVEYVFLTGGMLLLLLGAIPFLIAGAIVSIIMLFSKDVTNQLKEEALSYYNDIGPSDEDREAFEKLNIKNDSN